MVLVIVPFFYHGGFCCEDFPGLQHHDSWNIRYGFHVIGGLSDIRGQKAAWRASTFAYYNDVVELLSGEELTESEEKLIEKRLTSNVFDGWGGCRAIIDRNGKVYGVGNYSGAVSFYGRAPGGSACGRRKMLLVCDE